tara:strand:- start:3395 stop:3625 length:231 start_codon:yes stop_codon:yes gene_type:complete
MKFRKGLNDQYTGERYLTLTEASEYLGSGSHIRVSKLIKSGKLRGYKIPSISKLRVSKTELLKLITPNMTANPKIG